MRHLRHPLVWICWVHQRNHIWCGIRSLLRTKRHSMYYFISPFDWKSDKYHLGHTYIRQYTWISELTYVQGIYQVVQLEHSQAHFYLISGCRKQEINTYKEITTFHCTTNFLSFHCSFKKTSLLIYT